MKNKKLLIIAAAVVIVLAVALVLILTTGKNDGNGTQTPGGESNPTIEVSNRDIVTFANEHKDLVDANTGKLFESMLAIEPMLEGTYGAEEMYAKLIACGFSANEIKLFHVEQLYGYYNFENMDSEAVTFIDMLKYMGEVAKTEEGDYFLRGESKEDIIELSEAITQGLEILETPLSKQEYQKYAMEYLDNSMARIIAGNVYDSYNKKYNGGKNVKITPYNYVLYALNEMNLTTSLPIENLSEIRTMVNKAAAFYEKAKEPCSYDEFLPMVNEMMIEAKAFVSFDKEIKYTNDDVKQIYIMYFVDNGGIADVKMNGREFIGKANDVFTQTTAFDAIAPAALKSKFGDIAKIEAFLNEDTARNFEAMANELSALLSTTTLFEVESISKDVTRKLYNEYSK